MSTDTHLTDLASRTLGGSVDAASDEAFAERANLINPWAPGFDETTYGHQGKVYDGWETRRRRDGLDRDWAIVRLGVPGVISAIDVDTAWFKGNYPPYVSVEAVALDGYPTADELAGARWETIVEKSPVAGDTSNRFTTPGGKRFTHVRLSIYPDGGVARLRVHGTAVVDPALLPSTFDFAAIENGGAVVGCSDSFYTPPSNLILPGRARTTGEGWENARRRDDGNDHVEFELAAPALLTFAELDTSCFVYNAPGAISLSGRDLATGEMLPLLPRTRIAPDTRHLLPLSCDRHVTHVRMDVHPDGGLARVRLLGEIDDVARAHLDRRWSDALG